MPDPPLAARVARRLAAYYAANGYVRWQNRERLAAKGAQGYRKGNELRIVVASEQELEELRALLEEAGFRAGRPFRKHAAFCQPVYGKRQVARFLEQVLGRDPEGEAHSAGQRTWKL